MELGHEKLGKCRSTPITLDLWIKTTKNSTNPEIQIRAIFWGIFQKNFWAKIEGVGGEIREQPRALVPYDAGLTPWVAGSSRIQGGFGGKHEEHKEREEHDELTHK